MADDSTDSYDVVVLGGGSGGYACALRAQQLGLSVVVVEKGKLGGTCLHNGCIPTKALLHAAEVADHVRDGDSVGVKASLDGIDMSAVNSYKDGVVGRLYKGLQGLFGAAKIEVVEGEGRLVAKDTVEVDGRRLTGKNIVLATGSFPRTLPGLEITGRVMTSDQALLMDDVPSSAIVIGGSVIGVEFASVWRSFGVDVTIIEALPRLVPAEDETCPSSWSGPSASARSPSRPGRSSSPSSSPTAACGSPSRAATRSRPTCCWWPWAAAPASANLGFEDQGIEVDRGWVPTDERLRTNVEGDLRGRRPRPRSAAGPPRVRPRDLRGRGDRRAQADAGGRLRHPAGHVLQPRGCLRRSDRGSRPRRSTARSTPTSTTSAATAGARSSRRRGWSSWSARRTARSSAST